MLSKQIGRNLQLYGTFRSINRMSNQEVGRVTIMKLLDIPKSKQVMSFEEVMLDNLSEYTEWALACIGNVASEVDDALKPIVSLYGEDQLNYFEMRNCLRLFAAAIQLVPPASTNAARLYVYGCLEDVAYRRRDGMSMLEEIVATIDCREEMCEFEAIARLDSQFWHSQKGRTCESVLKSFFQEAVRLIQELSIDLIKTNNSWRIVLK